MYATLLWATDGSANADLALDEAKTLLRPGGRIVAFHCDQRSIGACIGGTPLLADETERTAKIRSQVEELNADGFDAELLIETTQHATPRTDRANGRRASRRCDRLRYARLRRSAPGERRQRVRRAHPLLTRPGHRRARRSRARLRAGACAERQLQRLAHRPFCRVDHQVFACCRLWGLRTRTRASTATHPCSSAITGFRSSSATSG